jgi:hypothetical protein
MGYYTFPDQTGFFSYEVSINPGATTGVPFGWGFGCSGCVPNNIVAFLTGSNLNTFSASQIVLLEGISTGLISFNGESGKLYDSAGNYFQSYQSGANFNVSGHVFTGRHNYFYKNLEEPYALINSNCPRVTGVINSFYIYNVGPDDFSLTVCN